MSQHDEDGGRGAVSEWTFQARQGVNAWTVFVEMRLVINLKALNRILIYLKGICHSVWGLQAAGWSAVWSEPAQENPNDCCVRLFSVFFFSFFFLILPVFWELGKRNGSRVYEIIRSYPAGPQQQYSLNQCPLVTTKGQIHCPQSHFGAISFNERTLRWVWGLLMGPHLSNRIRANLAVRNVQEHFCSRVVVMKL